MAVKYKEYKPEEYKDSNAPKNAGQTADYWGKQQLEDFQDGDFTLSDEYHNTNNALNNLVKPGDFGYSQQQGMQDIWNQIQNREKFSYDVNGDALYQQYKDQYINQGKMAMMDTMGQAAAMTGGYGNSYAQSVGQQAYQGYLQQLTDKIPELYSLAMSKYQMEGDELLTKYGLHTDQYNREYGQYRDSVSDYNTERDYLAGRADSIYNRDLGMYTTNRDTALAEVESRNNNITSNRNYYTDVYNNLKNTEWGQHMDNETLKQLAIQVANDNLYKNEQTRLSEAKLEEEQRQFNKQFEASTGYKTDGTKSTTFAKEEEFTPYQYAYTEDGQTVFTYGGKEVKVQTGLNPYTRTKNPDAKYGTFDNGYQPNNVNGKKLSKTGQTDVVNGVTQNVWQTPDGTKYIWDGTKNAYLRYED